MPLIRTTIHLSAWALLVALILLVRTATAQTSGQWVIQQKNAGAGFTLRAVTGTNSRAFGLDGSGNLTMLEVSGSGSVALDDLSDVTLTAAATNDFLVRGASGWVNLTPANARTALGLGTLATQSATITDYLLTATAASTYATIAALDLKAPLASPTFTGTVTAPNYVLSASASDTLTGIQYGIGWKDDRFTLQGPDGAFQMFTTGDPEESVLYWAGRLQVGSLEAADITGEISADLITSGTINAAIFRDSTPQPLRAFGDGASYAGAYGITYGNTGPTGANEPTTPGTYYPQILVVDGDPNVNYLEGRNRTAAQFISDLSLTIGTNVQAYSANLTTYAGITPSANVQSLLGAADYSAMRTQLGLVIGTDVLSPTGSAAGLTSFPTLNQSTTGNAATATALQTGRTINGTSFDGTANVTITAAAGTLTGTTLASNVVTSSLTSLGTIATGVWQGTAIADSYISSAATWNAKESALTFSTGLTRSTNTITVNTSQNIATLSNLTTNGFVKTSGGTGALSVDTATYLTTTGNGSSLTGLTQSQISGLTTTDRPQFANVRVTHSTLTYAGTTDIDLDGNGFQTVTLTGNITFTTSNRAAGRSKTIRIVGDASLRTLTFPAGWTWIGAAAPASLAANKDAILTITAFGTADTDIVAAYSAEP